MTRRSLTYIVALLSALLLLASCNGKKRKSTTSATGNALSLVAVLPDGSLDNQALRDSITFYFGQPVTILPQPEPMTDISFVEASNFVSFVRRVRNILYVSIDPETYSGPSVGLSRDDYASGQLIIHAKGRNLEDIYTLLQSRGDQLVQLIYSEELKRRQDYLEQTFSNPIRQLIEDSVGVTMNPPTGLDFTKAQRGLVWASNMDQSKRIDLVVYSIPYRNPNTFTEEYFTELRDSILGNIITGKYPGSQMTTTKRDAPPFNYYHGLTYLGDYRGELRGLWEMTNDMMGGSFVMQGMLDKSGRNLVIGEVFIYAPGEKQRNMLLNAEASLYTIRPIGADFRTHKMPNTMADLVVTPTPDGVEEEIPTE